MNGFLRLGYTVKAKENSARETEQSDGGRGSHMVA
jgi:hypothetical protein